jgi:hypothetical protein
LFSSFLFPAPISYVTVTNTGCTVPPLKSAAQMVNGVWQITVDAGCSGNQMLSAFQILAPTGGFAAGSSVAWTFKFDFMSNGKKKKKKKNIN